MPENERLQAFLFEVGRLHLIDWRFPLWQIEFMSFIGRAKRAAYDQQNDCVQEIMKGYYSDPQLVVRDHELFSQFCWQFALTNRLMIAKT